MTSHRDNEYAMGATHNAHKVVKRAADLLHELSAHHKSFNKAPSVLEQLGAELMGLGCEVTEIRNHLDDLAEEFGATE
jgi:hypothetical protein